MTNSHLILFYLIPSASLPSGNRTRHFGTKLVTGYNKIVNLEGSMYFRQIQTLDVRPTTTAHLAQTMSLLGLSITELREKIESELASNPALELVEGRFCPTCQRPLIDTTHCPICSRPKVTSDLDPIVFVSPREDFAFSLHSSEDEENNYEEYTIECEDLPIYILRQISSELLEEDRPIAAHILTSLDEDGLLRTPLLEIAAFHHVSPQRVERVQRIIQFADPLGVGSSSPKQAMLIQLEVLAQTRPIPPLAKQAIEVGLDYLSHHKYQELGRILGISAARTKELAMFIGSNLNPYPARANWGEFRQPTTPYRGAYYRPDIIISFLNEDPEAPLVVEIISPIDGKLRVNPLFREGLREATPEKVEHWQSDLEKATLLVKCLQQRNHAIVRIMQRIVQLQRDFILKGDAYLLPVTRAVLAKELEVHESTISRAVANKIVQLPSGKIIPLSKFFDRSLHIRSELHKIIAGEKQPLTDTEIANILRQRGYEVARRTVAKYRAIEGIMPAHMRSREKNQKNFAQAA